MALWPFKRAARMESAGYQQGNPALTRRRKLARSMSTMFQSALFNKNDKWTAIPRSPDEIITLRQSSLVARSREQWSNNDYVRAYIRLVRSNIVGSQGIKIRPQVKKPRGKLDTEANAAIAAAFGEWAKVGNCEVTGKQSWRSMTALCAATAARDGEFIIRKIYGADAGPFGFALQVIDPQRMLVMYEAERMTNNGGFIRQGIEFNKYGRPIAYHFTSTDESDDYWYSLNGRGFVRIPADEIIHGFVQEMVGQRRGLPWTSASLERLHHLAGFETASVQNARATASKMGFIQYKEGFGPEADEDYDVAGNIDAEPLSFHELPEGAELAKWEPQYPAGEFNIFMKAMLRGASAGFGILYNNLTGDLENVNFSSIRHGSLEEREQWKELQQWLIETLVMPVYEAWLKHALLQGQITNKQGVPYGAARVRDFKAVAWQGKRWTWIDPQSDVTAALESIRGGLTSISQVIREQGRDPGDVFKEIADDLKQLKEAGVPDNYIELFMNGQPTPPPPVPPTPEEQDDDK